MTYVYVLLQQQVPSGTCVLSIKCVCVMISIVHHTSTIGDHYVLLYTHHVRGLRRVRSLP
jgi:hypothetical protein